MRVTDFTYLMRMKGWVLFDAVLEESFCVRLAQGLEVASERCRALQTQKGLVNGTAGTAHHLVGSGGALDEFMRRCPLIDHVESWLGGKCILNSYGGVINSLAEQSYVGRVHRDVRSFLAGQPLMINMLVMLEDFTSKNGATWMLSGSHHVAERPSDEFFFQHADRLIGRRGAVALWDSYLWHAAGRNETPSPRRALTLTFTRPFIKQQLDYPRLLGVDYAASLDEQTRQLLGYNARVPADLDEWYQPPECRFYKADQG